MTTNSTAPQESPKLMATQNRVVSYITGAIFIAYAIARCLSAYPTLNNPRQLADTASYVRISGGPIYSIEFWTASRPPAFPLLLKVVGHDFQSGAEAQLAFSIAVWGILALAVSRFLKFQWLQVLTLCLILGFSLDRHISGWDSVMLTESLSVSSLALFLAVCLWLLREWRPWKVAAFFGVALLLAFTRDTNAWMLLALCLLLILAVVVRWAQARALILAGGLVGVFLLSYASATLGERLSFPLGNLITRRVLPNAASVQFFEACGMPVSPALLQLSGKFANSDAQAMFAGPHLAAFRNWLRDHAKYCYVGWLLKNPTEAIRQTLEQSTNLIGFPNADRFFSKAYRPMLPGVVSQILYPERPALWYWGFAVLAALIAIWKRWWKDNPLWTLIICLVLLAFPHLFLTWHGDAMAPDRHSLSVGVQLYLGYLILAVLVLQFLYGRARAQA